MAVRKRVRRQTRPLEADINIAETKETSVFFLDSNTSTIEALRPILEEAGYQVIGTTSRQAFMRAFGNGSAATVILDLCTPELGSLEIQRWLRKEHPDVPVMVMTGHGHVSKAVEAMRQGAFDFVEKPLDPKSFVSRVKAADSLAQQNRLVRRRADVFVNRLETLTPKERQVADLIVEGKTTKEIAHQFGVSTQAIDAHRGRLFNKLSVDRIPYLIRCYFEAGLLDWTRVSSPTEEQPV